MRKCPYNWCELKSFNYDLATGRLQFSTLWTYTDENGVSGGSGYTTAGDIYEEVHYSNDSLHDTRSLWTDQTRLTISPVPEPSRIALSAAGLLLIGGLRARRGQRLRDGQRRGAGDCLPSLRSIAAASRSA